MSDNGPNYRAIGVTTNRQISQPIYRSLQVQAPTAINPFATTGTSNAFAFAAIAENSNKKHVSSPTIWQTKYLDSCYPLSSTHVYLNAPNVDKVAESMQTALPGCSVDAGKGVLRMKDDQMEAKVRFFQCANTDRVVCEFSRLSGCAFLFQQRFLSAVLSAADSLHDVNAETVRARLDSLNRRMALFPNPNQTTAIDATMTSPASSSSTESSVSN